MRRQPGQRMQPNTRRGAVLVIVLLALSLLVGLVFFVFNLGDQINRRLQMQGAADSTAISGAGWMARSMNVVAIDNVTISRLTSLVVMLDSLPLAAEMAIAEEEGERSLVDALAPYRTVSAASTPYERDNFFRRGLAELYRQMNPGTDTDLELLRQIDAAFDQKNELDPENSYDIGRTTDFNSTAGRGHLWRAMAALDDFSVATANSAGQLAQSNAGLFGNQSGGRLSFIAPLLPQMPAVRTTFMDFKPVLLDSIRYGRSRRTEEDIRQVNYSRLVERLAHTWDTARTARWMARTRWGGQGSYVRGGAIPDLAFDYRLGPFARLYRWRDYWDQYEGGFSRSYLERWGYSTYGPLDHAFRRLIRGIGMAGRHSGTLDTSRFAFHLRTLAQVKVAYLFGLPSPITIQYSDEWISNYAEAQNFASGDWSKFREAWRNRQPYKTEIMTTRYYRVSIKSTVSPDDTAHWLNPSSWQAEAPTMTFVPRRWWSWQLSGRGPYDNASEQPLYRWIVDYSRWYDIGRRGRRGRRGGVMSYADATATPFSQHPENRWIQIVPDGSMWYRKSHRSRRYDRELGLPERPYYNADGEITGYENYTIYYFEIRVFGGIELRNEIELSSPIEGASLSDLPAPMLLDTSLGDYNPDEPSHDSEYRRSQFTFLGVAQQGATSSAWAARFKNAKPSGRITAVAQAELFNNRSWDLWTQDWRAQLVPVTQWDVWTQVINDTMPNASLLEDMDLDSLQEAAAELQAMDRDLGEIFFNH